MRSKNGVEVSNKHPGPRVFLKYIGETSPKLSSFDIKCGGIDGCYVNGGPIYVVGESNVLCCITENRNLILIVPKTPQGGNTVIDVNHIIMQIEFTPIPGKDGVKRGQRFN